MNPATDSYIVSSRMESALSWTVNVVIVLALPIRMGLSGRSIALFLAYAGICGIVLTIAEDRRYATAVFYRSDVRGYLAVRIAIVAVLGLCPFLVATNFA